MLEGGGNVGVARLADSFGVALESGALTAAIRMTRSEVRDLALRLIDASQIDEEE